MDLESYSTQVISAPLWVMSFYSEGPKGKIEKLIKYEEIASQPVLVNLGFGDRIGEILDFEDMVESKNSDGEKIMATVVQTIPSFFQRFPDRIIVVHGSTGYRSFIYRKIVREHHTSFVNQFTILGVTKGVSEVFKSNVKYDYLLIAPNYLLHLFK